MERFFATYLIETPLDIAVAAESLAGEQSSGTFVSVPGETEALKQRFAARIESLRELEQSDTPSLPGCLSSENSYKRAEVVISWPLENVGYNLPAIISTVQGNLYELRQFSGLKLMDLEFPASFREHFRGPAFGIEGTRQLADVLPDRPLIGTIIKPSVGLSPEETAKLVETLVEAGVDFIKDDELMADPPHSPFKERVAVVMCVVNDHAARTGKKVMVAFNISDEMDRMLEHYDTVVGQGGTCAMVSLNSVGMAGVKKICDRGQLAIHGHRNGWGMLNRHPFLGIEFKAYQKLWRLAGIDHIHVNGIQNKFCESDESVVRSMNACQEPMLGGFPILPVVSSGQWGGQAPETYRQTKTVDLLYLAGGGILGHPDGPREGVKALQESWEAAVAGLSLQEAIQESSALRRATEKFSKHNCSSPVQTPALHAASSP
ncbi:ribulose-bisphosphate carboxylase large subunit family protein [Bythopirellula polymerisocia]|uniref:Ribulose bisphosphate carboxylase-like protein n=1 Tax=Bythopirellula polymerisocia TaxID=2528003 RepID=A0A5C6CW04_9BACT|nr:ribulose-bisphosphate carboxylase large subunit family protein [Bythopirellula polymerisocia]TWU27707.1 Ribulose bisphosphate carboxylase-like protein [Bythopirellula polymerisocia]